MLKETERRIDSVYAVETPEVRDVLKRLSALARTKGSLLIGDLAREIKEFKDEPADAVWMGLKAKDIKISGIDTRPLRRRSTKTNGRKENEETELLPDVVGTMIKQGEGKPLLTHREEIEAFIKIKRGQRASSRIYEIRMVDGNQKGSRAETKRLAELVIQGNKAVKLVSDSNQGLSVTQAKKRIFNIQQAKVERAGAVEFPDMINDSNIGLLRVIKKFEWQRGHKFSTYATWWARQATTRSADNSARTIRYPSHFIGHLSKYYKIVGPLKQSLKRPPTDKEIIAAGMPPLNLKNIREHLLSVSSLHEPAGQDNEEEEKGDFIPDERDPYQEIIDEAGMKELVEEVLFSLTRRERIIAKLIGEKRTYQFIGDELGLTRERVRQIWEEIKEKTNSNFAERVKELLGPED